MDRNLIDELYASVVRNDVGAVRAALAAHPGLLDARDRLGSTPLHLAAFRGSSGMLELFLDAGAPVDALELESRSTPLHWAAEAGQGEIVRLLLERGASLEQRDAWFGLTPLGWATCVFWVPRKHRDRSVVVGQLRAAGARGDAFVELGANDLDALRRLVTADPAELTRRLGFAGDEMQPLHWAGAYGRQDAIALLIELGADTSARTMLGLTPLGAVLQRAQTGSAAAFLRAGFSGDESTAVVGGFVEALKDVSAEILTPALASRLLFVASSEGHDQMIETLVRRGADPAARLRRIIRELSFLATPLHVAAQHDCASAAKALLAAGAPPSAGAEEGKPTPLHVAAAEGLDELVQLLLEGGADREAREVAYDATPADWADFAGYRELAIRLRARS